jgi:acyl-CoA reductase-like NAD-dependent aldehyde dehydrogenase
VNLLLPASLDGLNDLPCIVQAIILISATHFFLTVSKPLATQVSLLCEFLFLSPPTLIVPLTSAEATDNGVKSEPMTNPQLLVASEPDLVQCWDPSTLQHLGTAPAMNKAQVEDLCAKAAHAQKSWAKTTYTQRRMVMRTIQKYILEHQEDICRVCARDSGKPKVDALLGEVMTTCEKIRCINVNGEEWLQRSYRPTGPMMMHKTAYVEYVPFGVLGVIAPWNYPFHNMLNHVISGLFSGNAVVSKVSEHTTWSASYFTRIVKAALEIHGHDSNVVQTLTGFGECGAALVQSSHVDKIIFTGSPAVGRMVMSGCAPNLKPCILELGGKDPMVFCDDVKIDDVVPWAMRGCFQNSGQNCCGVERLFVYESILAQFLDNIVPKVKALRQGVPNAVCGNDGDVDCGAIIMPAQLDIYEALVNDAVAKGAKLHCGGKRNSSLNGQFFEPTVISEITADMRISKEEVFGPIMCVITVPNDSDDECIRLVNACDFGLGSSVYAASQKRGMKIGNAIRSGMFTVNDFGVNYLIQSLPFGGVKESGFGRFAGPEGLRACCLERSIVKDRIWGVRTSIPPAITYPIEAKKGLPFGMSLVKLFYSEGLIGKLVGIVGLIKNS